IAPQPQRPPAPDFAGLPSAVTAAAVTEVDAVIAADDNTNILLISAPPDKLELIQGMFEQLDVLPPQVHIQAVIVEVSLNRDTALGINW
ncbi:MAG: hypothetical protein GTN78_07640, partial [Gemmatimonadales bacterium]|nr:hypothetical protein [Gemmatimonadales bacterium]